MLCRRGLHLGKRANLRHCDLIVCQAMSALGDERAFLAATAQKLDTSLEERERLLVEVAEAKAKVDNPYFTV